MKFSIEFERGSVEAVATCIGVIGVALIIATSVFGTWSYHKYENSRIAVQAMENDYVQDRDGTATLWVKAEE